MTPNLTHEQLRDEIIPQLVNEYGCNSAMACVKACRNTTWATNPRRMKAAWDDAVKRGIVRFTSAA